MERFSANLRRIKFLKSGGNDSNSLESSMISDQSVRDRVTHDHDTLFAVDAGAGTGKTTLLVSRLIAKIPSQKAVLPRVGGLLDKPFPL